MKTFFSYFADLKDVSIKVEISLLDILTERI